MINNRPDFGVLYGQKTTEDALLIYSSYEDSKQSPQTGDFIVLTPRDEDGNKFLARVEAEIYDEDPIFRSQDKTLVAVHYARIAERELSERDKQKMFSYTYKIKLLGKFKSNGKDFSTAVRRLPVVSYHARHLRPREFEEILNGTNQKGIKIGKLCIGDDIMFKEDDSQYILFDINKLKEKRTMIFAQSGFGKTNLMKVMIYHMVSDTKYGKLIFDLNGEYAFKGRKTYGLADINEQKIKDNLVLYTDKRLLSIYENKFIKGGKVQINMHEHLSVGDILSFGIGFSDVMKSFLMYLDENQSKNFLSKIDDYVKNPTNIHKDYSDFFGDLKTDAKGNIKDDVSARKTVMAIRKRISNLIDESEHSVHSSRSQLVENVFDFLKAGKTVIIDLSLKDNVEASIISTILVRKLFENNKTHFTSQEDDKIVNAVLCVEEAQNVLSEEFVKSNANPFVRVAKEGRKFGLGLIAITQRPSAISEEIRTQAENFFTFHLGNTDDIKALVRSNINFDGVISRFIQTETIVGNCYMVTSDQSFALPIRVVNFDKLIHKNVYTELQFNKEQL
ncbi:MAG: ATP-binding protein [Bacteroidales bacterium]|jgi:DNA helicase HerA-like ATPase|nr:ATP-binding protein [Bacteroidales bacterium]